MKTSNPQATPKLTRYAPTPSGFLHIGNVYSFILTALLAKQSESKILLRIDDMDRERTKDKYLSDIFETLDFLELPFDEGPRSLNDFKKNFSQYNRLELYQSLLEELRERKILFACDCSRKKIEKLNSKGFYTGFCKSRNLSFDSKETAWRIETPRPTTSTYLNWEGKSLSGILPGLLSDFVVRKKDGNPAYQICSVADDLHFGVTHVVRGNDLIGSTLAQVYLSKQLGNSIFESTRFHHHALIKGPDFQKLSKSAGATSIQAMRKSGKKKEAVYQLLGKILGIKKPVSNWEDFEVGDQG